jgi:hypothetical protein
MRMYDRLILMGNKLINLGQYLNYCALLGGLNLCRLVDYNCLLRKCGLIKVLNVFLPLVFPKR